MGYRIARAHLRLCGIEVADAATTRRRCRRRLRMTHIKREDVWAPSHPILY